MAWDVAAYAAALALLVTAGAFTAVVFRVYRSLRRWDRMAIRLALKADTALGEYVLLAREAREAAETWRHTVSGFARLSEAATAVGDIAESAAQTAANVAAFWRDRTACGQSVDGLEGSSSAWDWAAVGRFLGYAIRKRFSDFAEASASPRNPGASADPIQGE